MLLGCVIVGLWWFIISLIAHRLLSTRPNSMPLIGMNAWRCSTSQLVRMLYSVCKSSRTLLHLVACLLLSNAASTMWAIILVFGRKQFDIDYPQLMLIALATLIAASIGVYIWSAVQQCTGLTAHQMLILICGCYALLPVYGLAGFGTLIEFAHNTELQIMAAYHGLMLGAMQSYSRAVFVHLLSDGYENQYFSLYEVASKSMAWIGPLVVVLLMDQTRNHLYVFVGLLVAVLLAMLLAWKVDTSQTLAKLKTYVDAPIQHAIM
jgi:UMF1 family MFS transporter